MKHDSSWALRRVLKSLGRYLPLLIVSLVLAAASVAGNVMPRPEEASIPLKSDGTFVTFVRTSVASSVRPKPATGMSRLAPSHATAGKWESRRSA